jgi:outer membrane lipoprotein-sorting protein
MIFLRKRECALISVSLALLATASCRSQSEPVANDSNMQETVVSSTPPFKTKEPDRYRAIRSITTVTADGRTVVRKSSIARDGEMRRTESEGESKTVVYLDLPEGRFVLLPDEKVYAEVNAENDAGSTTEEPLESSPERLLHTDVGSTSYQKLGGEIVGGRNVSKYRVIVNSSGAANVSVSETLIWIDEALKMPIKSETKSADGTRVLMELSDITLEVDNVLFQIPKDYRKVTFIEFRKRLL